MAPPEFGDIGKSAKDLLSKDFNFGKTKIEVKTKTKNGVEFNSLLERNEPAGDIKGELKTKFSQSGFDFTDTYTSSNNLSLKVETKKFVEGLKTTVEGSFNPYSSQKEIKLGVDYKTDLVTFTSSTNLFQKPSAKADVVFSYDNISSGLQASFDVSSSQVSDYACAVSYGEADYAVTILAGKKFSEFGASYFHKVRPETSVAANASWKANEKKFQIEVGTQHQLDNGATLKAKFDSQGNAGFGYGLQLRPDLKANFALLVDSRNLEGNNHKLGLAFLFEPK